MFFMARATPPILPGWVVWTNMMRIADKLIKSACRNGARIVTDLL
jgi:hypothetical protein